MVMTSPFHLFLFAIMSAIAIGAAVIAIYLFQRYRRCQQDLTNTLESFSDSFLILDANWQIVRLSPQAETTLAKRSNLSSSAIATGKNFWQIFSETEAPDFCRKLRNAATQPTVAEFEEFYPPHQAWYRIRLCPHVSGLSVNLQDITQQRKNDVALLERSHLFILSAEVGIAFGKGGTLTEAMHHCLEAMVLHIKANFAVVWLYNPIVERLELQATSNPTLPSPAFCRQVAVGKGTIGKLAQTQQPRCIDQLSADELQQFEAWIQAGKLSTFVGYPLRMDDRLIGVMALFSNQPLTDAARSTLNWLASNIALGIDRFLARDELQSRRESLLFSLANQIHNSLDLSKTLSTTVAEVRQLFDVDYCAFGWYRVLPAALWEVVEEARSPEAPSFLGRYPAKQLEPLTHKLLDLEIIWIDNAVQFPDPAMQAVCQKLDCQSLLLLPLRTYADEIGFVLCTHRATSHTWNPAEVSLLQAVTDQLAIAIDQADLYRQAQQAVRQAETRSQQLQSALQQLQATQLQLIQTEKMSGLGQLIAGIAHEINNPVNFISGNLVHASNYLDDLLELVRNYQAIYAPPDPELQQQAEEIDLEFLMEDFPKLLSSMEMGTGRIRQLVLSLRNFSRLDEAEMKPVNLHEGIDNTLLILQHRWKAHGHYPAIEIRKQYGDLPLIECYAGQMNQVFMNLLSNAIDALRDEEHHQEVLHPSITIETSTLSSTTGHPNRACIRIIDNGPGIPNEVCARLFDPFFTTKPVGKGTGLGLSIAYQIVVERHQGTLQCRSEPGKGAEFWVEIPVWQPAPYCNVSEMSAARS